MGGGPAHRFVELEVPGPAREPLLPADHVRDLHVVVVHEHGEVVGGEAVGLHDDEVVLEGVLEGDVATDEVGEGGDTGAVHAEAQDRGLPAGALVGFLGGNLPAATIVAGGEAVLLLVLAQLRESFRGAEAAVGTSPNAQLGGGSVVLLEPFRLDVGAVGTADIGTSSHSMPSQRRPS